MQRLRLLSLTARQRLVALALGALLGLQLVGLWHGVQHARHGASAAGWQHDAGGIACELFDQLAHASALGTATPPAPAPDAAPPRVATLAAIAPWWAEAAPFDARAPPRG